MTSRFEAFSPLHVRKLETAGNNRHLAHDDVLRAETDGDVFEIRK